MNFRSTTATVLLFALLPIAVDAGGLAAGGMRPAGGFSRPSGGTSRSPGGFSMPNDGASRTNTGPAGTTRTTNVNDTGGTYNRTTTASNGDYNRTTNAAASGGNYSKNSTATNGYGTHTSNSTANSTTGNYSRNTSGSSPYGSVNSSASGNAYNGTYNRTTTGTNAYGQTYRGGTTVSNGTVYHGAVVTNPVYAGYPVWGWNAGYPWYPVPTYWGGGFWGPYAYGAGFAFGVYVGANNEKETSYQVQPDSAGAKLLSSYHLTQTQCGQPNLVVIFGPNNSVICAQPNNLVAAGNYSVNMSNLTIVSEKS